VKINPGQLATVLELSPSAISMAIKRDSLNKTVSDEIDLDDLKNHTWITRRVDKLRRKGREIPQDIKILFLATPITDDKKSNQKNDVNNQSKVPPAPGGNSADNGAGTHEVSASEADEPPSEGKVDPAEAERQRVAIESSQVSRDLDKAKLDEARSKADISKIKVSEMRRELIRVNPFGRMLFNIKAAERTQVLNAIPNIAQHIVDEIKSALKENIPDFESLIEIETDICDLKDECPNGILIKNLQAEWQNYLKEQAASSALIMIIQKLCQKELSKIFESTDKELKNKIRQAKNQLIVTDDEDTIPPKETKNQEAESA
jgi:hypothetical protein